MNSKDFEDIIKMIKGKLEKEEYISFLIALEKTIKLMEGILNDTQITTLYLIKQDCLERMNKQIKEKLALLRLKGLKEYEERDK